MVYRAAAATCPGKKKSYNSNNFYLNSKYITDEYCSSQVLLTQKKDQKGLQIYAVSEGYGADVYQDEASLIAVKNLFKYHSKKVDELTALRQAGQSTANVDMAAFVSAYIQSTNNAVKARVNAVGDKARNLQSTLALVCIKGKKVVTANLGDTRIYHYRGGVLRQISEDHTQAQKMVDLNLLTPERAASHPKRHKLTQYFGVHNAENPLMPAIFEMKSEPGDVYLICSRAFYENITHDEMQNTVRSCDTVAEIVDRLMSMVAESGFADDTTLVAIQALPGEAELAAGVPGTTAKAAAVGAGAATGAAVAAGTVAAAGAASQAAAGTAAAAGAASQAAGTAAGTVAGTASAASAAAANEAAIVKNDIDDAVRSASAAGNEAVRTAGDAINDAAGYPEEIANSVDAVEDETSEAASGTAAAAAGAAVAGTAAAAAAAAAAEKAAERTASAAAASGNRAARTASDIEDSFAADAENAVNAGDSARDLGSEIDDFFRESGGGAKAVNKAPDDSFFDFSFDKTDNLTDIDDEDVKIAGGTAGRNTNKPADDFDDMFAPVAAGAGRSATRDPGVTRTAARTDAASRANQTRSAEKSGLFVHDEHSERETLDPNDGIEEKKSGGFLGRIKSFLGIGGGDGGDTQIWPAVVVFLLCIVIIVLFVVLGIKFYKNSRKSGNDVVPVVNTATPDAGETPFETEPVITPVPPTDGPEVTTNPSVTDVPATDIPTETATSATQVPATSTPTPTATNGVTPVPTQTPTQEPTEVPPTDVPTNPPTDVPVTVTGIALVTDSVKKEYNIGDELDVTGLTITVTKSDSSEETVDATADMVSGFDSSEAGTKTLTVTYEGFTATFDVEIVDNTPPTPAEITGITVNTEGAKTTYEIGESLDVTGLTITVKKSDESEETVDVTADMISGFDSSEAGTKTLTVTYEGFTDTFDVEIVDNTPPTPAEITGITVNTDGAKTTYEIGESLDVTGLTITVKKSDDTEETVDVTADMISGFDSSEAGTKTLTVTYEGFTDTFDVVINEAGGSEEP